MRKLMFSLILIGSFVSGMYFAKHPLNPPHASLSHHDMKSYRERSITIALYAHNMGPWVEKSLRSVFEQDYENYKVILIEDASTDRTFVIAQEYVIETNQSARVAFVKNEEKQGYLSSLQAVFSKLPKDEIVLPIIAKDWLANAHCLKQLNTVFHSSQAKIACAKSISFPEYRRSETDTYAFYREAFSPKKNPTLPLASHLKGKTANLDSIHLVSNEAERLE